MNSCHLISREKSALLIEIPFPPIILERSLPAGGGATAADDDDILTVKM
jgi:hypothetical protein